MMLQLKKLMPATLIALMMLGVFAGAARADEAATRKIVDEIYAKIEKAVKDKDAEALIAFEAEDFTRKTQDGKILTRQEADAAARDAMQKLKQMQVDEVTTKIESVTGDKELEVVVTQSVAITIADEKGGPHKVASTSKSRDLWKDTGKGWKISYTEALEDITTVDGKAVD